MKDKNGLWKLSPSGLYGFTECKSCFWVDNNYKKARVLPLLLNSAMDSVLKHRYDLYREGDSFPPEVRELEGEGLRPFRDISVLSEWREKSSALEVVDERVGYVLRGKIDDVMREGDGRLVPVDYKSSGNRPAEDKQKYYVDQLAAYGFMFKKHGYEVSDRAYLLHYYVADKTDPSLEVRFSGVVDLVRIDVDGLSRKLEEMVELLNGEFPGYNYECEQCSYYKGRGEVVGL